MMQSDMVDLSLKEMTDLDTQFRAMVPNVVNSLKDKKQTASITITVSFRLCADSDTLVEMNTKIKATPASEKKATICRRDLVGNLKADAWDLGQARVRRDGSLFPSDAPAEEKSI